MLTNLTISNFAIVDSLDLDIDTGMTTITGETGAGKSISIDALGLCLGDRCEASMVRPDEKKAELSASFSLSNNLDATNWLIENDLNDGNECILRRIITNEGRSRGYINGSPVPASQLKALGQHLINIHGQHAHQQLVKSEYQLTMLDGYSGHTGLLDKCSTAYQAWRQTKNILKQKQKSLADKDAEKQLLTYKLKELDEFAIEENEYGELDKEHALLANSSRLIELSESSLQQLYTGEQVNAIALLQESISSLETLSEIDTATAEFSQMINEAMIQVEEVGQELQRYQSQLDVDPSRFTYVEERLSKIISLSKKHQVQPEELYVHHQHLLTTLEQLDNSDADIEQLTLKVEEKWNSYIEHAEKLSKSRRRFAETLNKKISKSMHTLNMEHGAFSIAVNSNNNHHSPLGIDTIEFTVTTNPGQPLQPLAKVASGGELSRISLAIQVITAQKVSTPSLIFDEVDVGISGTTAAIVGKMLKQLGESTQVICVTHLPQVAACGHQQMYVNKESDGVTTQTSMIQLDENSRVQELARLLAGDKITDTTLANAKELLAA